MQALGRGFPAECFAWSAVEFGGDGVEGLRSGSAAIFLTGAFSRTRSAMWIRSSCVRYRDEEMSRSAGTLGAG
ncbi:hypothetical protein AB0D59_17725 [Streptomyces sp. NPDC048417]|uniref:hypothetical protein n=1 Tax=Streptomyces sp. NPDC048417 TaxID=3155387 RepID=UPI00342E2FE4